MEEFAYKNREQVMSEMLSERKSYVREVVPEFIPCLKLLFPEEEMVN